MNTPVAEAAIARPAGRFYRADSFRHIRFHAPLIALNGTAEGRAASPVSRQPHAAPRGYAADA